MSQAIREGRGLVPNLDATPGSMDESPEIPLAADELTSVLRRSRWWIRSSERSSAEYEGAPQRAVIPSFFSLHQKDSSPGSEGRPVTSCASPSLSGSTAVSPSPPSGRSASVDPVEFELFMIRDTA